MPSGLISTSSGSIGASSISAASFANGATDRPWNELLQSMCEGSSSCSLIGSPSKPDAKAADVGAFEEEGEGEDDGGGVLLAVMDGFVADLGAASALWEKETEK